MDLLQNPFYILNASPRDNRRRIMELADERSLSLDSSECMKACSELTNPRKRLAAEVAWLPGVGPRLAREVFALFESSPADLLAIDDLPSMAQANLLVAGLARLTDCNADVVAKWILELASAFEDIDADELRELINEDRVASGFPEVSDSSAIEAEIKERRRYYRQIIKSALDTLSPKERVKAVTVAVEHATDVGEEHGPILLDDLVDSYEVEMQDFFAKEEENIKDLVEKLRAAVDTKRPDSILAPMVNQLIQVVENWDTVAQPIQVSYRSRGLRHDGSYRVLNLVRELSIHMYNEHGKLEFSQQLTDMLQEVFTEVDEIAERTAEDADTLNNIAEQKKSEYLLKPIFDICKEAINNSENNPKSAKKEAQKIIDGAPKLIKDLSMENTNDEIISRARDEIALTLMNCAIIFGNKSKKWKSCIIFLEVALKYAENDDLKLKIQKNIAVAKNNDQLSPKYSNSGIKLFIFIVIGIAFICWLFTENSSHNTNPSYVNSSKNYDSELQYTKPSPGRNNILSVSEIRWCIRENIRIDTMRNMVYSNYGISKFNNIVDDYNIRCGSYRYRGTAQSQAERDVAAYRSQIISEATREARQLDRSY